LLVIVLQDVINPYNSLEPKTGFLAFGQLL
jgi:hypothetical protein